jgi:hypothetical protein
MTLGTLCCALKETSVRIVDDDAIRALVMRLARPHPSGGDVIERSVILAEGADSMEVIAWITAHAGTPETRAAGAPRRGLHGSQLAASGGAGPTRPPRYVLPPGALA